MLMKEAISSESKPPVIDIKEAKPKFITQFDPETGEFEWFARINPTRKKITGGSWVANFQKAFEWLGLSRLNGELWSVLATMIGRMDFNNYIRINQTALAKELHMKQSQVSRAIKKLLELDVICEGPRAGLCKTYMLNPNVGIKGKQKQQKIIDYAEKKRARELEKDNEASKDSEPQADD